MGKTINLVVATVLLETRCLHLELYERWWIETVSINLTSYNLKRKQETMSPPNYVAYHGKRIDEINNYYYYI